MFSINSNYMQLQGSYLFSEIARRVREYGEKNPDKARPIASMTMTSRALIHRFI